MATIGKSRAVAANRTIKLTGRIAWLAWLLIHVYQLIGFRNRTTVHLQLGMELHVLEARSQADHRKGMALETDDWNWQIGDKIRFNSNLLLQFVADAHWHDTNASVTFENRVLELIEPFEAMMLATGGENLG